MSAENCDVLVFRVAPQLYKATGRVALKCGFRTTEEYVALKIVNIVEQPVRKVALERIRDYEKEKGPLPIDNYTGLVVSVPKNVGALLNELAAEHSVEPDSLVQYNLLESVVKGV